MYLFSWASLVFVSLWVSLIAFFWALRSGQFSDQARARYLPLTDDYTPPALENPSKPSRGFYALLFIGALGLLVLLAPVIMSL